MAFSRGVLPLGGHATGPLAFGARLVSRAAGVSFGCLEVQVGTRIKGKAWAPWKGVLGEGTPVVWRDLHVLRLLLVVRDLQVWRWRLSRQAKWRCDGRG